MSEWIKCASVCSMHVQKEDEKKTTIWWSHMREHWRKRKKKKFQIYEIPHSCKQSKDSFFSQYNFVFVSNIRHIYMKKKLANVEKEQKFPIYISAVDVYDAKQRSLIFCK